MKAKAVTGKEAAIVTHITQGRGRSGHIFFWLGQCSYLCVCVAMTTGWSCLCCAPS